MAYRVLRMCGAVWLGASLTVCGSRAPAGDDEALARAPEKSGADIQSSLSALTRASVRGVHADGIPDTLQGELGRLEPTVSALSLEQAAAPAVAAVAPVFRLRAEDLVLQRARRDTAGNHHLRYRQTKNGLDVIGGELLLHARPDGTVFMVNGSARDGVSVSARPQVTAAVAVEAALKDTRGTGLSIQGEPRLVYVRTEAGPLRLAWETRVAGEGADMPLRDRVYVSATDSTVLLRAPEIHGLLKRKVYSFNGTLPGKLVRVDWPSYDSIVDANFDMLGYMYNCYKVNFGRDSYDGSDHTIISTVHYLNQYSNAYWDGNQLVYGDGDGVNAGPLGIDGDVTVHELTHAVTESESNLTFAGQSGALSEGISDTFSAYCQSWQSGTWSTAADVWKIGEGIWTPPIAGDALRYMDDPVKDGDSIDYASDYTSSTDAHYGSGIPNLAFALLSKGGTHPRGRSSIHVPAIGVQRAGGIWYKANTEIFVSSTTFEQAKAWTIMTASLLGYDQAHQDAVKAAWEAVGVGVNPQPPPLAIALGNGVPVTGLSGAATSKALYTLDVPANKQVVFTLSGGTGDADLYVRFGEVPIPTYDCRPYLSGNAETCTLPARATAGKYYVIVHGFAAYAGVTLQGQYSP
ncbi:peptidase M4 [Corallococcus llansteffanensis]|uniref:Neutral metalloproteinase n=2 Tax=Corallococcus llansteffanensis TaxID=2316731 RepID=A0A3A8Q1X4_9BACT|nr:peptidase M4 [Corallococcus llansteffanensis]